jgi:hypothetical protein
MLIADLARFRKPAFKKNQQSGISIQHFQPAP